MAQLDAAMPSFSGPTEMHSFAGVLFDMDGTIVDSTAAIVKHWHKSVEFASCTVNLPASHMRIG